MGKPKRVVIFRWNPEREWGSYIDNDGDSIRTVNHQR
jgi:hypothetical protein